MRQGNEREKSDAKMILEIIKYFSLFHYAPSDEEIIQFYPVKRGQNTIKRILNAMVNKKKLISSSICIPSGCIYAIPGHSIFFRYRTVRTDNTKKKLVKVQKYFSILYRCSWIRMAGISGSCAMNNATKHDDVDVFIITGKKRLWLGRLWALGLAEVMRVRRRRNSIHVSDKICLNMFFDEAALKLPEHKINIYTAHEVVQMRPIAMRQGAYNHRLFLKANSWIQTYFPNIIIPKVKKLTPKKINVFTVCGNVCEYLAKRVQKAIIARHHTKEIITDTQLWFFPKDFELKITRYLKNSSSRFR